MCLNAIGFKLQLMLRTEASFRRLMRGGFFIGQNTWEFHENALCTLASTSTFQNGRRLVRQLSVKDGSRRRLDRRQTAIALASLINFFHKRSQQGSIGCVHRLQKGMGHCFARRQWALLCPHFAHVRVECFVSFRKKLKNGKKLEKLRD